MESAPDLRAGAHSSHAGSPARLFVLVGFMGSGKSSTGRALGRMMGWRFEDLDEHVEQLAGRPIAQIFEDSGEPAFRQLELSALQGLLSGLAPAEPLVLALGGGSFSQPEIAAALADRGAIVIHLEANLEELWTRCQESNSRPLRRNWRDFEQLYHSRQRDYARADFRVETGNLGVEDVASEIIARLLLATDP